MICEQEIRAMLHLPVNNGSRIGLLYLHMPASEFISTFANPDFVYGSSILEMGTAFPRCLIYRFLNSITVYVDAMQSRVYQIILTGDYKGDLLSGVHLNDNVSELKRRNPLISFIVEEEYIYAPNYPIVFAADDDIRFDSQNLSKQTIQFAKLRRLDESI